MAGTQADGPVPRGGGQYSLAEVQRLLAAHTGLRLKPNDLVKAAELLNRQAPPPRQDATRGGTPSELERAAERVAAQFVPTETYFFRDQGQFDLLRLELLPKRLQARQQQRTLRFWSAGCASGEEAYSLAMLVDMALPERARWHVTIIGSDFNEDALARARIARYGEWSFRQAPATLKQRYFRQDGSEWVLREDIRSMVTFRSENLMTMAVPDALFRDMDLILCRNVFIYFEREAVAALAHKLAACLAPQGYLVAGHTELQGLPVPGTLSRLFPEGLVHQRVSMARPSHPPPLSPTRSTEASARGALTARLAHSPAAATQNERTPYDRALASARALADQGDYEAAASLCRKALEADPLAPASHFLFAQLAQLRGDYQAAEEHLTRTLYLAPDHIAAYLELAALDHRMGRADRAAARRRAALELLRGVPCETKVEPFETNAGELIAWLLTTEGT